MINNDIEIDDVIEFDINNEIPVGDLIYAIDKSYNFSIYEINTNFEEQNEKNILIKITKRKEVNNAL